MKKEPSTVWKGGLKDGKGTISTKSGDAPYGFNTRFENGSGTNPEELIGAAHAGCFSMALSAQLREAGMVPESINTTAAVTPEKVYGGLSIPAVDLDVTVKISGTDRQAFEAAANKARTGCRVSKLLNAAEVGHLLLHDTGFRDAVVDFDSTAWSASP
jgi:osmotically inducible protein OsmC